MKRPSWLWSTELPDIAVLFAEPPAAEPVIEFRTAAAEFDGLVIRAADGPTRPARAGG